MTWEEANKRAEKELEITKKGYLKMVFNFLVEEEEKTDSKINDSMVDFSCLNEEAIIICSKIQKINRIERFAIFVNPEKPIEENLERLNELIVTMFDSLLKIKARYGEKFNGEKFSQNLREQGLLKEREEFSGSINSIVNQICPQEVFNIFGSSHSSDIQRVLFSSGKNTIMEILKWTELLGARREEAEAYYEVFGKITNDDDLGRSLIGEKSDMKRIIKQEEADSSWWQKAPDYIKENINWDDVIDDYLKENLEIESYSDDYFFWKH